MALFEVQHLFRSGLSDISFSLSAPELACLSGPSGTGKTLLLRALVDLDVNRAEVRLAGVERGELSPTQWRKRVGFLPADSRWWGATVADHFQKDGRRAMLRRLGFGPEVLGWQVERLSSGERQRLALARLLENQPQVLLLDEPTANLDPDSARRVERLVSDYLHEHPAACVWVTHAQDQIERIADRTLYLDAQGLREAVPA